MDWRTPAAWTYGQADRDADKLKRDVDKFDRDADKLGRNA